MTNIDPSAIIDSSAELDRNVSVGPYSIIGKNVKIASGTKIGPHVVIKRNTTIGSDNRVFQFASIGEDPQDKKYAGEETYLTIGDKNTFREFCTIHRGTDQDEGITKVGNNNLFMAYTHVAHDCHIGNEVIMANAASLGGHVKLDNNVILGGFSIIHQFCRIGIHSFAAMGSVISKDVPPFIIVSGHPAKPHGLNSEGLKRRGFDGNQILEIKTAYKILYQSKLRLEKAISKLEKDFPDSKEIKAFTEFLNANERSIVR